jgi:DNA-binding NarL/FixJ family response regulator
MNPVLNSPQSAAAPERTSGAATDRVRVLVADPDGLARSMIRFALGNSDRIGVVHTAATSREALELARHYRPTVAIVGLTPGGGIDLVQKLLLSTPDVLVLTVSDTDHLTVIAALRAGAVGHIGKDIDPDNLAELVGRVADGEVIVSQPVMPSLLEALRDAPATGWRPLRSRLTNREWEIVEMLGQGATTQRIADQLVLSPLTVYSHVKSLLRKLGVRSRREAVIAGEHLRREEALRRSAT